MVVGTEECVTDWRHAVVAVSVKDVAPNYFEMALNPALPSTAFGGEQDRFASIYIHPTSVSLIPSSSLLLLPL